jgi:hypothetical protein
MQGQEDKQVERRAFLRLGCVGRASFEGSFSDFWAVCKNISMGGAAVFTDANVPTAELLDLRIDLGEYGEVQAVGKVLRSRSGMLGIQFLVLSPASRFAIAAFTSGRYPQRVLH